MALQCKSVFIQARYLLFIFGEFARLACWYVQVEIVKIKMDKDRKKILERRARPKLADEKKGAGKHKEKDVQMDSS